MWRLFNLGVVLAVGASCGRNHPQREGTYALTIDRVVRSDCSLAEQKDLPGTAELVIAGDTLRVNYSFFQMQLVGLFDSGVERFEVDGSVANVTTLIAGQQCLLDLVTTHLEATTKDAATFDGTLSVEFEAKKESCDCELWLAYTARRVP